ncbi:MAG: sugar ABC transporter permease [Actinomycetota bacterium]|nr:sugar ABC transporter permease [Actinomycetota bacterium]
MVIERVRRSDVKGPSRSGRIPDRLYPYALIAPAMIVIGFFALYPLGYALNLSLRDADLTSAVGIGEFVGLENYHFVLNDEFFWDSLRRTLIFAGSAVTIELALGMGLALLIGGMRWFQGVARTLIIVPIAASPLAVGLIWRYMYHPDFGVFNGMLAAIGLPEQNWLGDVGLAMVSVVIFDVWQWTPFVTLIFLAGLQAIPLDIYEAGSIDGASSWQTFRFISVPMLSRVIMFVFILRLIDAVRLYDAVFALTAGGPGTATEVLTFYIYRVGLRFFRVDLASAMSILFLYGTIVVAGLVLRKVMREQAEHAEAP